MPRLYIIIFFVLFFVFAFPSFVFAHGGFERRAGDITVYINQSPISPLVGENVKMNFVFKEEGKIQALSNFKVDMSLIDTFYGDQSKDKLILKKSFVTDVNGSYDFDYTFHKENFFDVEFTFKDPAGNIQTTGYLIQPRQVKQNQNTFFQN